MASERIKRESDERDSEDQRASEGRDRDLHSTLRDSTEGSSKDGEEGGGTK